MIRLVTKDVLLNDAISRYRKHRFLDSRDIEVERAIKTKDLETLDRLLVVLILKCEACQDERSEQMVEMGPTPGWGEGPVMLCAKCLREALGLFMM